MTGTGSREALVTERSHLRGMVFIGCGHAARMHARTLHRLAPALPLWFASRSAEKARETASRLRGAGAFGSYDDALRDERTDVAVIVTPPARHLEGVLAALSAGKHVIVEKPALTRSADFDAVERASAAAGRSVLVAENYAYKPLAGELRRILREGRLGRLLFLHVNALKRQSADGWRADTAQVGGGALLEGGIHWISLLAHLGPEVREVRALAAGRPGEGERSTQVLLRYDDGAVASLAYSWEVPSLLGGLRVSRIYGTEGTATFESNGLFVATGGRRRRLGFFVRDLLGYRAMFRDFLAALRSGRSPAFTLADARRDVEIVEAAYRSAGLREAGEEVIDTMDDAIPRRS